MELLREKLSYDLRTFIGLITAAQESRILMLFTIVRRLCGGHVNEPSMDHDDDDDDVMPDDVNVVQNQT